MINRSYLQSLFQIKIRGEAEAFAIHAKAKAEAEQMAKKAEAYKEYREAAMIEMLLEALPKVGISLVACLVQLLNKLNFRSPPKSQLLFHKPRRSRWSRRATAKLVPPSSLEKSSRLSLAFPSSSSK